MNFLLPYPLYNSALFIQRPSFLPYFSHEKSLKYCQYQIKNMSLLDLILYAPLDLLFPFIKILRHSQLH